MESTGASIRRRAFRIEAIDDGIAHDFSAGDGDGAFDVAWVNDEIGRAGYTVGNEDILGQEVEPVMEFVQEDLVRLDSLSAIASFRDIHGQAVIHRGEVAFIRKVRFASPRTSHWWLAC